MSFFKRVAATIFQNHLTASFLNLCLIVPSRRAAVFLKKALAENTETAFFSPKIISIDDFIVENSGLQVIDNVSLTFLLFEIYQKIDPETEFDKFIAWAPTVLKDYDIIDQYLVEDTGLLFKYMSEAEAIKRWSPDLAETPIISESVSSYFDFYSNIGLAYEQLRHELLLNNKAYKGMAYRLMAQKISDFEKETKFNKFYFIGLNALSKSEKTIIQYLVSQQKASCIWDEDIFFRQPISQAGKILNSYRQSGKYGSWSEPEDILLSSQKNIQAISCSFSSIQFKLINESLKQKPATKTVIVVPDEAHVRRLLFSLDEKHGEFNISMGLALSNSSYFNFYLTFIENYEKAFQVNKQNRLIESQFVINLLKNPLFRRLSGLNTLQFTAIENKLNHQNVSQFTIETLKDVLRDNHIAKLFEIEAKNGNELIIKLLDWHLKIGQYATEYLDILEQTYFGGLTAFLQKLTNALHSLKELSFKGLLYVIKELAKVEKIDFSGSPDAAIQVMSMLETRCLDFDNVIFLSFNEGVYPSDTRLNSLIPHDAARIFELPVYADQESITAYHFFRLLMRAKNADLFYVESNATVGGKSEKSRYLMQIKDVLNNQNRNINFLEKRASLEKEVINQIEKVPINSEYSLKIIHKKLFETGISVSFIDKYLHCKFKFYLSEILNIKENNQPQFGLKNNEYGQWIHKILEIFTNEYFGINQPINIQKMKNAIGFREKYAQKAAKELFGELDLTNGENHIFYKMALENIKKYFEVRIAHFQNNYEVIGNELKLEANVLFDEKNIKLKGFIDNVEYCNGHFTLIDFKTGKVKPEDLKINEINESLRDFRNDKMRQLILYRFLFAENTDEKSPKSKYSKAKIYSFRNLKADLNLEEVDYETLSGATKAFIIQFAEELSKPDLTFEKTDNLTICKNCNFAAICMR